MTGKTNGELPGCNWSNALFSNLLPVTIGNIFGGAVMVGLVYWLVYARTQS
jgi:formate transporter